MERHEVCFGFYSFSRDFPPQCKNAKRQEFPEAASNTAFIHNYALTQGIRHQSDKAKTETPGANGSNTPAPATNEDEVKR
ncbi:hypothetical protein C0J52_25158 [Blattella germanica]|nr:hypothetical protein C0J52_25158 [Blattella germanica]